MEDAILTDMLAMGFDEATSRQALKMVSERDGNLVSMEAVVEAYLALADGREMTAAPMNTEAASVDPLGTAEPPRDGQKAFVKLPDASETRMVIVVRRDLKMGTGKIASQVAHAAVALYVHVQKNDPKLLQAYEKCATPKICLKCETLDELNAVEHAASINGLWTYAICDAGRTQIERGSKTCCAIIGTKEQLSIVTGHLKLL